MVATTLAQALATRTAAPNTDNLPGWKKLKQRLMAPNAAAAAATGPAQQSTPHVDEDANFDTDADVEEGDEGLCFSVEKIREIRALKEKERTVMM
ncbi:hypothetical protein HDU83_006228 [Entophlyctis luteolus]|nr:hypothetical protein HDU83_006228 [Entophlyctis luteolus]